MIDDNFKYGFVLYLGFRNIVSCFRLIFEGKNRGFDEGEYGFGEVVGWD